MADDRAAGAAVGRQRIDIEHPQAGALEHLLDARSATDKSSARDRSCRTGSARSDSAGAGTRTSRRHRASARSAMPPTKSLMSGTWASTLLPISRSAFHPSRGEPAALSLAEEQLPRFDPPRRAAAAVLAVGSIPRTGIPPREDTAAGSRRCWPARSLCCCARQAEAAGSPSSA